MAVGQFAREYTRIRRAEGWGSADSAYYQALPHRDLTRRNAGIWRIRARTHATFIERVLAPMEHGLASTLVAAEWDDPPGDDCDASGDDRPPSDAAARRDDEAGADAAARGHDDERRGLRILDLGAGNGWLANRLALRGHFVTAVDLLDDPLDGLRAARHYRVPFASVLAEFDHLPLAAEQVDLAVFNASLHYSTNYTATLRETLRVLRAQGTLVILDSPMYVDPTSGARMVQERRDRFLTTYGFASDALASEHFLTPAKLNELSSQLGLSWELHQPRLDWRSAIGRRLGSLRARREAARFPVIVGRCR